MVVASCCWITKRGIMHSMPKPPPPESPFWKVFGAATVVNKKLFRLTKGRVGGRMPGTKAPILILHHVGAKSGQARSLPLIFARDGDDIAVVASKGGVDKHPAWFHNLKANPETTIQVGSRKIPVRAKVATAAQRKRLWPKVVDIWSDYAEYQKRTDRKIPLVILEPR